MTTIEGQSKLTNPITQTTLCKSLKKKAGQDCVNNYESSIDYIIVPCLNTTNGIQPLIDWLFGWCLMSLSALLSQFIGGGSRSDRREQPTVCKTNWYHNLSWLQSRASLEHTFPVWHACDNVIRIILSLN